MIRPAQKIIKNQNAEEGIGRDSKLQSYRLLHCRTDSIQPVEIEIHCDASVLDDHLLKRPAVPVALDNFPCTAESLWDARLRRGKEQEQGEGETGKR
jgi:hypothetical protein